MRRMGQGCSQPTGAPAAVVAAAAAAQAIARPLPGAPRWASASFLAARARPRSMDGRHRSGAESHGDLSLGDSGLDWEGARPHPGMETWSWPAPPLLSSWPSQQAAQVRLLSRACAMVPGPRRCGQWGQKLLEVLLGLGVIQIHGEPRGAAGLHPGPLASRRQRATGSRPGPAPASAWRSRGRAGARWGAAAASARVCGGARERGSVRV